MKKGDGFRAQKLNRANSHLQHEISLRDELRILRLKLKAQCFFFSFRFLFLRGFVCSPTPTTFDSDICASSSLRPPARTHVSAMRSTRSSGNSIPPDAPGGRPPPRAVKIFRRALGVFTWAFRFVSRDEIPCEMEKCLRVSSQHYTLV